VSLGYDRDGRALHTRSTVWEEMVLTVCSKYPGLPDYRTMEFEELEFFYEGIRRALMRDTK